MDKTNQLGKNLQRTQSGTDAALRREYKSYPSVQRTRDIFDWKRPFDFEFEVPDYARGISLGLIFNLPPASVCAETTNGCFAGICEAFLDTVTVLTTTYDYISSSVIVYNNDVVTTNYTKTGADEITLGFTPASSDVIKVCYVYQICNCGLTDTFTRTVGSDWGTNDAGIVWQQSLGSGATASVDGSYGVVSVPQGTVLAQLYFTPSTASTVWEMYTSFIMPTVPTGAIGKWIMYVGEGTPSNFIFEVDVGVAACGYATNDDFVDLSSSDFTAGATYAIRLSCDGINLKMKLWASSTSEPDWQIVGPSVATLGYLEWRFYGANDAPQPTMTWKVDLLDIPQINSCTE